MIKYDQVYTDKWAKTGKKQNDFFGHLINLLVYDQLYTIKWGKSGPKKKHGKVLSQKWIFLLVLVEFFKTLKIYEFPMPPNCSITQFEKPKDIALAVDQRKLCPVSLSVTILVTTETINVWF